MISILIPTKNRGNLALTAVRSILQSDDPNLEIILIDQNRENIFSSVTPGSGVRYLHVTEGGKSAALNTALRLAHGEIIAFTDDDCLVRKDWSREIRRYFGRHAGMAGVFGRTLPFEPEMHKGQICPCTHETLPPGTDRRIAGLVDSFGFGNNMAFRKPAFERAGYLKSWLGPGAVGANADDVEITIRIALSGGRIGYDPDMIVYHNRWLTPQGLQRQQHSYDCGEMACYGYYFFQGYGFSKPVLQNNLRKSRRDCYRMIGLITHGRLMTFLHELPMAVTDAWFRIKGLVIGLVFSRLDPLQPSSRDE